MRKMKMKMTINRAALLVAVGILLTGAVASGGSYADGRMGKGVMLDGKGQSIKVPHYAGLKPAKAITISAWIKPAKIAKDWWWQEIYRKEKPLTGGLS